MNICNCESDLNALLFDMPALWRTAVVDVICKYKRELEAERTCEELKECESLTFLSPFEISDTKVCIRYSNEKGLLEKKCFDVLDIVGDALDGAVLCGFTPEEWSLFTFPEKIQKLIDKVCEVYNSTTTTTTPAPTTTTTTSSTTTTTTQPCPIVTKIQLKEITTTTTTSTTSTSTTTSSTTTTTTDPLAPTTTSTSTTTTALPEISGTVAINCDNTNNCTVQGNTSMKFTFNQPTPVAMRILVGYIVRATSFNPDKYQAYGWENLFTVPAWAEPQYWGYEKPYYVDIPAGVTSFTAPYLYTTVPATNYTYSTCQHCLSPFANLYVKGPQGYKLNLINTQGIVTTNL